MQAKRLRNHRIFIIHSPILKRRQSCYFFKHFSKGFIIRIANFAHYFKNSFPPIFQSFFRNFHFYTLQVFNRRIAGSIVKTSVKISSACCKLRSQFLKRNLVSPGSHKKLVCWLWTPAHLEIYRTNYSIQFIVMQGLVMHYFIQFIKRGAAMLIFAPILDKFPFTSSRIKMYVLNLL